MSEFKSYIGTNLRLLRKRKGLTQDDLAKELNIGRHSVGSYEEQRADPKIEVLLAISRFFQIPIIPLVEKDLTTLAETEMDALRSEHKQDVEGKNMRVLSITVDKDNNEMIELVHQKAAAGYLNGYADREYHDTLPKFNLPLPEIDARTGTYRAFQVGGDSMLPIRPGSYILAQHVLDWTDVKDNEIYIVISETEGVVLKRVKNRINKDKKTGTLLMISDNTAYEPYEIPISEVREIWKAKAYISTEFPDRDMTMERLTGIVMDLQQEVIKLKVKN